MTEQEDHGSVNLKITGANGGCSIESADHWMEQQVREPYSPHCLEEIVNSRDQMEMWVQLRQPYLIYGRRPPDTEAIRNLVDEVRPEIQRLYSLADSGYCPEECWLKTVDATVKEVFTMLMDSGAEGMASVIEVIRASAPLLMRK